MNPRYKIKTIKQSQSPCVRFSRNKQGSWGKESDFDVHKMLILFFSTFVLRNLERPYFVSLK